MVSNEFLANKRTELVALSLALFDLSEYGLLKHLIATANNHHTCNKNQGFCSPLSPITSLLISSPSLSSFHVKRRPYETSPANLSTHFLHCDKPVEYSVP